MMASKRRGVTLVLVLVSLMLAAALITPLAMFSGVEALESAYHADTLRHELAAASIVAMLPELLAQDPRLRRALDRSNRARLTFRLEEIHVDVLIQDDTAKLPLPLVCGATDADHASQTLSKLGAGLGLLEMGLQHASAAAAVTAHPPPLRWTLDTPAGRVKGWAGCLDDLFAGPTDRGLFGTPDSPASWSQYLSPLGRSVHVGRANAAVLEAALADLQPGLGRRIAQQREQQPDQNVEELLASLELADEVRQEARRRLTTRSARYSLLIRTTLGRDARQRYAICTATDPPRVLVNWEVAP